VCDVAHYLIVEQHRALALAERQGALASGGVTEATYGDLPHPETVAVAFEEWLSAPADRLGPRDDMDDLREALGLPARRG
jgi:hypothetical protein